MKSQLHKRLPLEFVLGVLEAFNEHRLSEEKACELLGIKRARLYRLWMKSVITTTPRGNTRRPVRFPRDDGTKDLRQVGALSDLFLTTFASS